MPRVVHFEIPADNTGRAVQFYKAVFDWDIKKTEMPMEYYLATTGKEGTMGINGAIMEKKGATAQTIVNTIDVPSVDEFIAKIKKAGGKQVTKKDTIPGIGDFCYCMDTEGNLFGILQPQMG
ncbi:MAG TPA: VOC family protein [Spirochaetia bacterium]|nr:VOC family protein [Spirochaetia bacterium]